MKRFNWFGFVLALVVATAAYAAVNHRGSHFFDKVNTTTLQVGGTSIGATPAELDVLDGVTAGTVTLSKAVVVDASKNIGTFGTITTAGIDAAAALALGNTAATSVSICNSATCDTVTIGSNADADTITIGDSTDTTVSITDDNWSVTAAGIASFAHVRTVNGTPMTAADVNLTKANIQAAGFWVVDTTSNAVDVDFADDAALDAGDLGSEKIFAVTVGHATQALTVTAGASGVTTVVTLDTLGTTCEDTGDFIKCLVTGTATATCITFCAD